MGLIFFFAADEESGASPAAPAATEAATEAATGAISTSKKTEGGKITSTWAKIENTKYIHRMIKDVTETAWESLFDRKYIHRNRMIKDVTETAWESLFARNNICNMKSCNFVGQRARRRPAYARQSEACLAKSAHSR